VSASGRAIFALFCDLIPETDLALCEGAPAIPTQKRQTRIPLWSNTAQAEQKRGLGLPIVPPAPGLTKARFWILAPAPLQPNTLNPLLMPTRHNFRQHTANEKLRKEKRLQKLKKQAKKRAVQGGAPAAGA
jgi:hypothetical protein